MTSQLIGMLIGRFILLSISKCERNFPPHQLFAFAVGFSFSNFVIHNPSSQESFISITSSLIRHSPFGIMNVLNVMFQYHSDIIV